VSSACYIIYEIMTYVKICVQCVERITDMASAIVCNIYCSYECPQVIFQVCGGH
jgi:hypothetical protein